MIEAYAFFAMFMVQIMTMSVLHPARLVKYCRLKVAEFPPERFPQLHSAGVFVNLSTELNPLDTHEGNVHMIGLAVKSAASACVVCVVFLSLIFTLDALAQQSWKPFAVSAFLVFSGLLCLSAFAVPPRKPEADAEPA